MINTDDDAKLVTARDYAIGLLSGGEYAHAATVMERDRVFAAEVSLTEEMLATLALKLPAEDVADDFFDRLEARLDSVEAAAPQCAVSRAGDGIWIDLSPGARIKVLHTIPAIRRQTYLLELEPGAVADNHTHDDDEECYVISGDIWFGETQMRTGDYHLARKGSTHGTVRSTSGCLCVIITALD